MCCICSGGLWEGEDCWVSKTMMMMMMMITKGRGVEVERTRYGSK